MQKKDILLAPIYLYQGMKVKRDTVRLPEPTGERHGTISLDSKSQRTLNIMMVGDSSAAGVGVEVQQNALMGNLATQLANLTEPQLPIFTEKFNQINWTLHATTGHTSFDVLRRLYVLPAPSQSIDIMMIIVGVNDTTANVNAKRWQKQLEEIITICKRKFAAQQIIFSCLPPMALMPALPSPLNHFMGNKASAMDDKLQEVCAAHDDVNYLSIDFNDADIDLIQMFASDGFHPSGTAYQYWSKELTNTITQLLAKL